MSGNRATGYNPLFDRRITALLVQITLPEAQFIFLRSTSPDAGARNVTEHVFGSWENVDMSMQESSICGVKSAHRRSTVLI